MTVVADREAEGHRAGPAIVYRPLTADDGSAFLGVFNGLSTQSRYMRYHGVKPTLSGREVRYFTDVDHHDHEAIIAVAGTEAVGVARYVRRADDPRSADVAVEVVDRWQRRGVGSVLLRLVARRARDEGVDRFHGSVLQSNVAMLAAIKSLRAPCETTSRAGPVLEIAVKLGRSGAWDDQRVTDR
jgi:GNAT superfamily N-acetyltransferase